MKLSTFQYTYDRIDSKIGAHVIGWGYHRLSALRTEKELFSAHLRMFPYAFCSQIIEPKKMDKDKMFCAIKWNPNDNIHWVSSIFTNSLKMSISPHTSKKNIGLLVTFYSLNMNQSKSTGYQ